MANPYGYRIQSRRAGGYSLRRSLEDQGVTTEEAMRAHIAFVGKMLSANPSLDIQLYRVDPKNPNKMPPSVVMG